MHVCRCTAETEIINQTKQNKKKNIYIYIYIYIYMVVIKIRHYHGPFAFIPYKIKW